jgi:hypothetical protein
MGSAKISDAYLWGTQREGWSIKSVICEYIYLDFEGEEESIYRHQEFGRL